MFVHIVIYDALYGGLWLHTVSCHICWHHHITSHFLFVQTAKCGDQLAAYNGLWKI